jgi:hypothetical protein
MVLNIDPILRHADVFPKRRNLRISFKLGTPVIILGALGKHLNQDNGIEECCSVEFALARDDEIRIGVEAVWIRANPLISTSDIPTAVTKFSPNCDH